MKIAQIVCVYPPYAGGIGTSALQFAQTLSKEHEVTTFTPLLKSENGDAGPNTASDSATADSSNNIVRLRPLLRYGNGSMLCQLFRRLKKFDTIYLHYPYFGTAEIVWLYKIFHPRAKLIIHYHMDTADLSGAAKILSWPARLIRNSLFNSAAAITCASLDYIENSQIARYYAAHKNKFQEIPFGVDTDKFKPTEKSNFASLPDADKIKNILFVGGLDKAHYFKGLSYLLEAAAHLPFSDWQLTLAGSGDLQPQYEEEAAKLGIARQVKFTGRLDGDGLTRTYQAADLFVLPSINSHEAFGIVLLEAMACGVPVIASNLPGVRAVFSDGIQGLICSPKNSEDLKNKIVRVLTDENLRQKMGRAGRELVLEKYSLEKVSAKLLQIFKE